VGLASRGLRDPDMGAEPIADRRALHAVRRQAGRVVAWSAVTAAALTLLAWLA
jgi:hypothetical protein